MIKEFENYLKKRGIQGNWKMSALKRVYTYILVVPAFDELEDFPVFLKSLSTQPSQLLKETLLVVVINNSEAADEKICSKNQDLHRFLLNNEFGVDLSVIDAYSDGFGLPSKHAGVGLARKIGMDLSISWSAENAVFGCLDADVILAPNYLERLKELKVQGVNAAVLSFEHQKVKPSQVEKLENIDNVRRAQKAIMDYENFLKNTAIELGNINSPYSYVPLGSAMYCTVKAYVAIGGMPKKKAAEDFYFLQALAKYCGVRSEVFEKPIVFPSARESERAYLGTGYRMIQVHEGFEMTSLQYKKEAFFELGKLIELVLDSRGVSLEDISEKIKLSCPQMAEILKQEGFDTVWPGFSNLKNKKQFEGQFHKWFDGLKTLRSLKALS